MTKRRLFTDIGVTPTDALLRKQLGVAFPYYAAILETSGGLRRQWQFSRGNGWLLKVDDARKALYYMIAFEDGIEISLTVRDAERSYFMSSPRCRKLQTQLEAATKYPEGYALRFEIEQKADCESVTEFLVELIEQRRNQPLRPKKEPQPKAELAVKRELREKARRPVAR